MFHCMDEKANTPWYEEPYGQTITPEQQRKELLDGIIELCEPAVQAMRTGDTGTTILYIRSVKTYAKRLKEAFNND